MQHKDFFVRIMNINVTVLGILMCGGLLRVHGEQECSQYNFQERVLEKLVRLEHEMAIIREKMTSWEAKMKNEVANLHASEVKHSNSFTNMKKDAQKGAEKTNNKLSTVLSNFQNQFSRMSRDFSDTYTNVSDMFDNFIDQETTKLKILKDDIKAPMVIFKARSVANKSPTSGNRLIYNHIVTNIGNGYDASTGYFTVPHNGSYMFTINTCVTSRNKNARMNIIAADVVIGISYNYNTRDVVCTTGTGVSLLKTGDLVWVKFVTGSTYALYETEEVWNSFSGHFIRI